MIDRIPRFCRHLIGGSDGIKEAFPFLQAASTALIRESPALPPTVRKDRP